MPNETVARRYAVAIFELAHEAGSLEAVGADLRTIYEAISADDGVSRFFYAPIIDRDEKTRVITETFGRGAHQIALHALLLLVRKRRERLLGEILSQYEELQREARGSEPLTISTAHELSKDELESLVARLSNLYKKKFDVTARVEPGLIGGIRIMMGDKRIDGSIAGRLDDLARVLSQN